MTGGRSSILGATGRNVAAGMSGGAAYVLDLDQRGSTREMVELDDRCRRTPTSSCATSCTRHAEETGSAVAAAAARRLGAVARPGSPRSCRVDYRKVLEARARSRGATGLDEDGPPSSDDGGRPWLTRAGFMTTPRELAPKRRPVDERIHDWNEVYPGDAGTALLPIITEQAGRCMDCGIPFCHHGCPLGNLIPEWNDLVWRDDWDGCDRAAARDEQLPGVHRPAVPGAVRDGLRRRHQPRRR